MAATERSDYQTGTSLITYEHYQIQWTVVCAWVAVHVYVREERGRCMGGEGWVG